MPQSAILPADPSQVAKAIELADAVAKVQGNIFIKELLRSKKKSDSSIRIGITKDEIVENLRTAISEGKITYLDIAAWVTEVEGWGRQHAYLLNVTPQLAGDLMWGSDKAVFERLKDRHLEATWKNSPGLSFPEEFTLALIDFANEKFECIWRRGVNLRQRDKSKDKYDEPIEGDIYDFHAFRHVPTRSVMRFEMYPSRKEAVLFVQIPLGTEHTAAVSSAYKVLDKLFKRNGLVAIDISKAIKTLDKAELDATGEKESFIKAQATKFSTDGANIEFSADPAIDWKSVTAVRRVRQALKDDNFDGNSAKFTISLRDNKGLKRDLTMSLTGFDKRVYLHAQMSASEVMETLAVVRNYAAA
jgi:hypothetical protein